MRIHKSIVFVFCTLLPPLVLASEITINARELNGGVIPSGYDRVNVITGDGNYHEVLYLPSPDKYMEVSVSSSATYQTNIEHDHLIINNFPVRTGEFYEFKYLPEKDIWSIIADNIQTFSTVGDEVEFDGSHYYIQYIITDGDDYTDVVKLPIIDDEISSDIYVNIKSRSEQPTQLVEGSHIMENNVRLRSSSDLHFKYNSSYKKWHLLRGSSYSNFLESSDIENGLIPEGLPNFSDIVISDGSFANLLIFPQNSYKGQTISIENKTENEVQIELSSDKPRYTVMKGQKYVFAYHEFEAWQPVAMPEFIYEDLTVFN